METIILAFAGGMGSGKTTLSTKVSERLGWPRVSFGDYVREVATERGLDHSRETLQALGESLINEGWTQFCKNVLNRVNWHSNQSLVIDGIRHIKALETIKQLTSPSKVIFFYILLDTKDREKRLVMDRGEVNLQKHEVHSTEKEVHSILPQIADLCLDGTQDVDTLIDTVLSLLKRVGGKY